MEKKKVKCEFCGNEFFVCNINQHKVKHYNGNYEKSLNVVHVSHEGLNCIYCGKECKNKNSLAQHEIRCKNNPNRLKTNNNGRCNIPLEKRGWSKGLTKETDSRLKNLSIVLNTRFENNPELYTGHPQTQEFKERLKKIAKENNYYLHFKGSRKTFKYKDFTFMSTYEVEVAKNLDANNIKWVQPKELPYVDNSGKSHKYIPDFYLPDYDVYLDPKNDYLINNVNAYFGYKDVDKINWVMQQNNVTIIILDKNNLNWDNIIDLIKR